VSKTTATETDSDRETVGLFFRCSEEERRQIKSAAALRGISVQAMCLRAVLAFIAGRKAAS
jgi:uncharacterized protein (DUF1778 family)